MGFEKLADFGNVAGDGFALGAGFFEILIEVGRVGFTIGVDEILEFFLVFDEIGDKSRLGFGKFVLVVDKFGGRETVFDQTSVQGNDEFAVDGFEVATEVDTGVGVVFLDFLEVALQGVAMGGDGGGLRFGKSGRVSFGGGFFGKNRGGEHKTLTNKHKCDIIEG